MAFFCKEGNELDESSKFKAQKKRIDSILLENEVMYHVLGNVSVRDKDKTQELAMYNKGEVRAQRIFIDSIKDHLIPLVAYFITSYQTLAFLDLENIHATLLSNGSSIIFKEPNFLTAIST